MNVEWLVAAGILIGVILAVADLPIKEVFILNTESYAKIYGILFLILIFRSHSFAWASCLSPWRRSRTKMIVACGCFDITEIFFHDPHRRRQNPSCGRWYVPSIGILPSVSHKSRLHPILFWRVDFFTQLIGAIIIYMVILLQSENDLLQKEQIRMMQ